MCRLFIGTFVVSLTSCLLLAACASDVVRFGATLTPASPLEQVHLGLQESVHVESSSGYGRDLPAGSVWEFRGTIEQGRVYRRVDGILTVEGAHVHEAFLVLANEKLVGFYLPVERAFSPAREAVTAKLK